MDLFLGARSPPSQKMAAVAPVQLAGRGRPRASRPVYATADPGRRRAAAPRERHRSARVREPRQPRGLGRSRAHLDRGRHRPGRGDHRGALRLPPRARCAACIHPPDRCAATPRRLCAPFRSQPERRACRTQRCSPMSWRSRCSSRGSCTTGRATSGSATAERSASR